ncbi:MAG: hypothetical protein M3Q29_25770, partial [Chloroflexota bacterium]|nr:hypothetical protein [Chloroflexota bacterium]
ASACIPHLATERQSRPLPTTAPRQPPQPDQPENLSRILDTAHIPLSIFNSGAVPIVVTDLRLRMQPSTGDELLMHLKTFRATLRPGPDDVEDFTHPYSVPGRAVVAQHVEFVSLVGPAPLLSGDPATAVVEALLDHKETWTELGRFPLHVEIMAYTGSYITYSNQPHAWQPGLPQKAAAALKKLRKEMGLPEE